MKINKLVILIICMLFSFNSVSEEIQMESSNMNIINNGNTILADNAEIIITKDKININSEKAEYDKIKNIVTFVNKVFFNDKKNEIIIKSDFLRYERDKDLTYSKGKTELNILENYDVSSENIYFDRKLNKIFSKEETTIEDSENNIYILREGFEFDIFLRLQLNLQQPHWHLTKLQILIIYLITS